MTKKSYKKMANDNEKKNTRVLKKSLELFYLLI